MANHAKIMNIKKIKSRCNFVDDVNLFDIFSINILAFNSILYKIIFILSFLLKISTLYFI